MQQLDNPLEALNLYRTQIDLVDQELISCLAQRFELSRTIGLLKRGADVGVFQPHRAKEVEERYLHLASSHGLPRDFIVELFQLIHDESCRIQTLEA